ncbi:universal stress protein [Actinomadura bangladeshensis]|uniref:Universal stress protein n=1 Tax=Actinomadura bangladeshensis TaxID=453573 RepID=A0A4R4P9T7_9ACTN|nr:universal stress protein [Actinomadura bangladeshensis]TDC17012.1 universal stress protein [Actinomadura bangladeshensis]
MRADHDTRPWREPGLLVGYDDSDDARFALGWALAEARLRHCAVTVCGVWSPPWDAGIDDLTAGLFRSGESRIIGDAVAMARRWEHGIPVHPLLLRGFPVTELRHASSQADLLVVGSRGHGAIGRVLGSVSAGVAAHALCPVVIARPPLAHRPGTPIVAGFDGSDLARRALEIAYAEAELHNAPLVVLRALLPGTGCDDDPAGPGLDLEIDRLGADHPSVRCRVGTSPGKPRDVLLEAARDARMLVVGSRGAGGVRGLVLGSVSQHLVHHAPCTMVIAHHRGAP